MTDDPTTMFGRMTLEDMSDAPNRHALFREDLAKVFAHILQMLEENKLKALNLAVEPRDDSDSFLFRFFGDNTQDNRVLGALTAMAFHRALEQRAAKNEPPPDLAWWQPTTSTEH